VEDGAGRAVAAVVRGVVRTADVVRVPLIPSIAAATSTPSKESR
jgi:hypothetical protein